MALLAMVWWGSGASVGFPDLAIVVYLRRNIWSVLWLHDPEELIDDHTQLCFDRSYQRIVW
jgi:hypothetical protein